MHIMKFVYGWRLLIHIDKCSDYQDDDDYSYGDNNNNNHQFFFQKIQFTTFPIQNAFKHPRN